MSPYHNERILREIFATFTDFTASHEEVGAYVHDPRLSITC